MARVRLKSEFSMDPAQTGIVNGYINGIADNISTKQYVESAVTYASDQLSAAFEQAMDRRAFERPHNFYHVYNWGDTYGDYSRVGLAPFRLWKIVTMGSGRNKALGFTFLPETVPSPIEPELLEIGVNEGVHVFRWKATVMEYGIEVEIAPKLPGTKNMIFYRDGEIVYRKQPVRTIPGYRTTTGMFTAYFMHWWGNVAPQLYENTIKPQLEADVITNADLAKVIRQATRRRRKNIGISTIDEATGEALARKHMNDNRIDYVRKARRKRLELYGY